MSLESVANQFRTVAGIPPKEEPRPEKKRASKKKVVEPEAPVQDSED